MKEREILEQKQNNKTSKKNRIISKSQIQGDEINL